MSHPGKEAGCVPCLCPEIFSVAELEGNGLMNLAEDIFRQTNIQIVARLLLSTFRPVDHKGGEMGGRGWNFIFK